MMLTVSERPLRKHSPNSYTPSQLPTDEVETFLEPYRSGKALSRQYKSYDRLFRRYDRLAFIGGIPMS